VTPCGPYRKAGLKSSLLPRAPHQQRQPDPAGPSCQPREVTIRGSAEYPPAAAPSVRRDDGLWRALLGP
jgi:hypothetical protein